MILTLQLDPAAAANFEALRQELFPPERNVIAAHVTLFHALPDGEAEAIVAELARACQPSAAFPVAVTGLRYLGRGVAFQLESRALTKLRQQLRDAWEPWLTPQDRQTFRPHITVQNKVTPETARATLAALRARFEPRAATGLGLDLWEYRNGPWAHMRNFPFGGPATALNPPPDRVGAL